MDIYVTLIPYVLYICIVLLTAIHGSMRCSLSPFQTRLYRFHPWNRTTYTDPHGWRKYIKIVGKASASSATASCVVLIPSILGHMLIPIAYRQQSMPCRQIMRDYSLGFICSGGTPNNQMLRIQFCHIWAGLISQTSLLFRYYL